MVASVELHWVYPWRSGGMFVEVYVQISVLFLRISMEKHLLRMYLHTSKYYSNT